MATVKSSAENLTLNADGSGNDILFQSNGSQVGSLTAEGVFTATSFAGSGAALTGITSVGGATGVDFNDNVKARFGTGNDLEIYHDASHSRIKDVGTGNLYISGSDQVNIQDAAGEPMINCVADGAVQLAHHGDYKLATSATGVTVTGTMSSDAIIVPGAVIQQVRAYLATGSQITSSGGLSELSTSLRCAITPKHADSYLILEASGWYCIPNSTHLQFADFYDVTASATPWMATASGSRKRIHWAMRTSDTDANDFNYLHMRALGNTGGNTNARTYTVRFGTEGVTAQFLESTLSSGSGVVAPFVFTVTEVGA